MAVTSPLATLDALVKRTDCTLDQLLYALANARRRTLLAVLAEAGGSATLASAAQEVAARVPTTGGSRGEQYRRTYLDLYHVHVPELVSVGLVEYDDEEGTVRLTTVGSQLGGGMGALDNQP